MPRINDEAAPQAVAFYRFQPATRNEVAVSVDMSVNVPFHLRASRIVEQRQTTGQHALTERPGVGRVYGYENRWNRDGWDCSAGARMSFGRGVRTVVTDSHFLVPFVVLLAGIALLVVLH